MKGLLVVYCLLILIFFSIEFASAYSDFVNQEVLLKEGQNITLNGKTIILKLVDASQVVVDVDGVERFIQEGSEAVVSGVKLFVEGASTKANQAWLNITINFMCGDDVCSANESDETCCKDCHCGENYGCISNRCVFSELNKCNQTNEKDICNDSNPCTIDSCEGIPRDCVHTPITECKDFDNCCPAACNYSLDKDCPISSLNQTNISNQSLGNETAGQNIGKGSFKLIYIAASLIVALIILFYAISLVVKSSRKNHANIPAESS